MKILIISLFTIFSFSASAGATFKCAGTEPFWNMAITTGQLIIQYPANPPMTHKVVDWVNAHGFTENAVFVVKGQNGARATVALGSCNDGMSDIEYTHTVVLENPSGVFGGCCSVK